MADATHDPRIAVPRLPPRHVPRPRLTAGLERAADVPLTLVCAGPGAGKTVLLTEWAGRTSAQVAWLAPTAADATPERFWPLLAAALTAVGADPGDPRVDPSPAAWSRVAQLPRCPGPESDSQLVLVIDDAHLLSHPEVLGGLDCLVRGRQPGLRLVLAARSDPLLPLHRYRLAGQLHEVRADDLAMTRPEVSQVLAAHGVSLDNRDFGTLMARAEGWAAGVRLSAMRMEGRPRPGDFVTEFELDSGSIGEYLIDEVVSELPEPERRLLVETSFLDEVTGQLADAVTGMTGCADMLADLAAGNSFVIPLDAVRVRYRYHHMFRETLRHLLQRRDPGELRVRHERAADWLEAHGDPAAALRLAARSADVPRVAALLARGGFAHAFVRRQDLTGLGLRDLLPLLRPDDTEGESARQGGDQGDPQAVRSAEAAIAASAIEAAIGGPDSAARELRAVRSRKSDPLLADRDLRLTRDLLELALGQQAWDVRAVDTAAGRLLGEVGEADDVPSAPVPGLRAVVLLAQATAHLWHGTRDDVDVLLDRALAEALRDRQDAVEIEILSVMAFADSCHPRPNRADHTVRRARALLARTGLAVPAMLELATAVRALTVGDLAAAARALERVSVPAVVGADPALPVAVAITRAAVLLADGRAAQARAMLQPEAGQQIVAALAARRDAMLADLDTALGRPRSALRLLDPYQGTEFAVVSAMARARACLALRDLHGAADCTRSVLRGPTAQVGRGLLVEAMLCDGRIAQLSGAQGQAVESLVRAIEMARGEIVLPFLSVTAEFADLLARHPDVAARWPTPPASVTAKPPPVPAPRPATDLPDPLTPRELTILRLLTTSMSTAEIAEELCVSVNTVKTHLAAVYRKLLASGRRQAVVRARELELI